jgi:hypothetical protein
MICKYLWDIFINKVTRSWVRSIFNWARIHFCLWNREKTFEFLNQKKYIKRISEKEKLFLLNFKFWNGSKIKWLNKSNSFERLSFPIDYDSSIKSFHNFSHQHKSWWILSFTYLLVILSSWSNVNVTGIIIKFSHLSISYCSWRYLHDYKFTKERPSIKKPI